MAQCKKCGKLVIQSPLRVEEEEFCCFCRGDYYSIPAPPTPAPRRFTRLSDEARKAALFFDDFPENSLSNSSPPKPLSLESPKSSQSYQSSSSSQSNNGQITAGILVGVGVITFLAIVIGIETTIMIAIGLTGIVVTISFNH
ncbi:MAG: hypothetical protein ACRCU2_32625 [Planktothrix sp.]